IRTDPVQLGTALGEKLKGLRVGTRVADRQCDLAPGYRKRLHDGSDRRLPQPMSDLVMERLDVVRLDDARVVAQTVIHLRAVGLGVDRLQLDALDILVLFGSLRRRVNVEAILPLPN